MRCILAACVLFVIQTSAGAHDFKMKVGKDTFAFDYNYTGETINVYESLPGEPYSGRMESIAHNYFAVEDILAAIPDALSGMKSNRPLRLGATDDIGANAFAAIYNGERYIVIGGLIHKDYTKMTFVMGHELGHHICGHTSAAFAE
jgi:Peptidase family M48